MPLKESFSSLSLCLSLFFAVQVPAPTYAPLFPIPFSLLTNTQPYKTLFSPTCPLLPERKTSLPEPSPLVFLLVSSPARAACGALGHVIGSAAAISALAVQEPRRAAELEPSLLQQQQAATAATTQRQKASKRTTAATT